MIVIQTFKLLLIVINLLFKFDYGIIGDEVVSG